jgi:hypothetical protein
MDNFTLDIGRPYKCWASWLPYDTTTCFKKERPVTIYIKVELGLKRLRGLKVIDTAAHNFT